MPKSLTVEQVEKFHRDGFASPMTALSAHEAAAAANRLERYEADTGKSAMDTLTFKGHMPFSLYCDMIRNPRILILDEATSALDSASEALFIRNLKRASRGRTIILVSHRMAPVSVADEVILVIDGQIDRAGPPTEMIDYAKSRLAEYWGAIES